MEHEIIVIDSHTLGYRIPGTNRAECLHTSTLKGSSLNQYQIICLEGRNVRPATEQDFQEFNVCSTGYQLTK